MQAYNRCTPIQLSCPYFPSPTALLLPFGTTVLPPIVFTAGTQPVSALGLSIDYDELCLSYSAHAFSVPASYNKGFTFNPTDTDGELDISIVDFSPPYAIFETGTILTITFNIICTPAAGQPSRIAPVLFSTSPNASFGGPAADDVPGQVDSGSVLIMAAPTPTPSSTPTLTSTPSAGPGPTRR